MRPNQPPPPKRSMMPLAAVFVLAAIVLLMLMLNNGTGSDSTDGAIPPGTMELQIVTADGAPPLPSGATLPAGAQIRLRATVRRSVHAMVMGQEEGGRLFVAWPAASAASRAIPGHESPQFLDGGLTMGDSTGAEVMALIACSRPFLAGAVRSVGRGELAGPDGCAIVTVAYRKMP